jgi:hypothetical protein
MQLKAIIKITAAALALACSAAYAQDDTFDPRALAMGGTGVTTANIHNAAFHNAAMLASTKEKDDFSLEFPIVAVRVLDPESLQNDMQQLSASANSLSTALTAFQAAPNPTSAATASSALTNFNGTMAAINHKSLMANGLVGTVMAIPSKKYAFSLYLDARVDLGAQFNYSASDQTTIGTLATNINACGGGNGAACTTVNNTAPGGSITGLTSNMRVAGVVAKDIGIATARHFDSLGGVDIGIVPKLTQYQTYDYVATAQSGATVSLNSNKRKDYSAFNLDLGAAKVYKRDNGTEFKTGLALKNLLSKSFVTVEGNTIDIKPQATLGASFLTKLTTTGIDLDVIANKPMIAGLSKESQYLRVGAEFDAWEWAQLRVGYRHDIKGNYPGLPSVGLGLSPFGLHFDLSVAAASKKEAAASMQLGFNF